MKSNKILKSIFALSAVVLAMTGCKQEPDKEISLRLSKVAYTFPAVEEEGVKNSVSIEVIASAEWTVESADAWITISDKEAKSVVISAANNDGPQREAKIIFKCGIAERTFTVTQLPYEPNSSRYRDLEQFAGTAISANGKYVAGYLSETDEADRTVYTPVVIDVATDEWHYLSSIPKTLHSITDIGAVSDEGTVFFNTNSGSGSIGVDMDDNLFVINSPVGFRWAPNVYQVSSDGKTWVGYAIKTSVDGGENPVGYEFGYWPVVWNNGEPRALKRPNITFKGYEDVWGGCMVRGVSADGKVMYGTAWTTENEVPGEGYPNDILGGMISWDKDGEVFFIGGVYKGTQDKVHVYTTETFIDPSLGPRQFNIVTGIVCTADSYNISETGKWIAGTLLSEKKIDDNKVSVSYYPAFYNTETNETTIFDEMSGMGGLSVTDDGIGFIIPSANAPANSGYVVNVNDKTKLGTAQEWILEKYGINVPKGYVRYMAADGETIYGIQMISGGAADQACGWYVTTPKK